MSYATLEEVWGPDYITKRKKSKREKRLETQEKKMLQEAVDPDIVIPKIADIRKQNNILPREDLDSFNGYDRYSNRYSKPILNDTGGINVSEKDILENNRVIEERYHKQMGDNGYIHKSNQVHQKQGQYNNESTHLQSQLGESAKDELQKMIQLPEEKYNQLLEGFKNTTDEQFNQLILYIFTGIFYLFLLDMMYQLGKKSY